MAIDVISTDNHCFVDGTRHTQLHGSGRSHCLTSSAQNALTWLECYAGTVCPLEYISYCNAVRGRHGLFILNKLCILNPHTLFIERMLYFHISHSNVPVLYFSISHTIVKKCEYL